jgi:hypothetical protein
MSAPDQSGSPPTSLIRALEKILRPIVRVLLHHQFTYPQFIALLKSVYVDVAETEMQIGEKRQSDSRINLLTGVHRKDVKRLRAESNNLGEIPGNVSVGAQLIGHWMGHRNYLDEAGNPLPLPIKSESADDISFEKLVALVVKQDIRPRVILDEWLRLGIARVEDDKILLNTGAFTPDKGFDEKAFFFGKNLHDHASAGASNLLGLKPSYFDRSVYYDQLSPESVKQLNELAHALGMEALTAMNKAALARQEQDATDNEASYRINFGVFHYDDITREPDQEADDD